jgi:membrane associated rhomboid family serine protease
MLYVVCGALAVVVAQTLSPAWHPGDLGGSLAIAALMGAYLVLFPNGKVLVLIPVPVALHELPAVVLFTFWCAIQFLGLALLSHADAPNTAAGSALGAYGLALAMGAALCLLLRRRERAQIEWWDPR